MPRSIFLALFVPALLGAGTTVLYAPLSPSTGPFPSDALTVFDPLQKTGLRVNMPVPDCGATYTACQEGGLLDQLDGFSIRARARVRFSGAVNPATLKDGIFYVALDNLTREEAGVYKPGDRITADQVVWDPATNTAYAKPVSVLDQHRRYALIVTDAVKDSSGAAVQPDPAFQSCAQGGDEYCGRLAAALGSISTSPQKVVAASVFTTMSATAWLEHARAILDYVPPMASLAQPQSSFHIPDISSLTLHEQIGENPARFADLSLPLQSVPLGGLDRVVIGSYFSPNFLQDDQTIDNAPTLPGLAVPSRVNQVYFNALLPAGPKPAAGYPVVIFGHGFGDSRFGGPTAVAPVITQAGFAVIAINAVGHGFGSQSTVTFVDNAGKSTTLPAGGRSIDLNGDGVIEANEGCALVTPVAYGTRDCFRQTAVDLMQLARVIRQGLDLDGDGVPDLDPSRIYYAGQSLGAIYGTMVTAVEPTIRAAALNVGGGSIADIARWSPSYRDLAIESLQFRQPPLLNQGAGYNEDYVLPGQPVKVTTVPGAIDIQNFFETVDWLGMSGDPLAFAPHVKLSPLPGVSARPVLMQFARGDQTVPNPTNSALVAAAGLQSSTWLYRHDLARAAVPDLPANPHPYLVLFVSLNGNGIALPGISGLAVSLAAQQQIADFVAADGAAISDPNGVILTLLFGTKVFEIPKTLPLDLGF